MLWRKRKRKIETHLQNTVRFLGEQDGESERLLKSALIVELRAVPEIKRAYLARVEYADGVHVALCIAGPQSQLLVERIGSCFARIFAQHEHLDTLFLRLDREAELERVCAPFHRSD